MKVPGPTSCRASSRPEPIEGQQFCSFGTSHEPNTKAVGWTQDACNYTEVQAVRSNSKAPVQSMAVIQNPDSSAVCLKTFCSEYRSSDVLYTAISKPLATGKKPKTQTRRSITIDTVVNRTIEKELDCITNSVANDTSLDSSRSCSLAKAFHRSCQQLHSELSQCPITAIVSRCIRTNRTMISPSDNFVHLSLPNKNYDLGIETVPQMHVSSQTQHHVQVIQKQIPTNCPPRLHARLEHQSPLDGLVEDHD